jgi:UDPglucose 6-dehydrogenase
MKVSVFGAGYVGLVTGACLSEVGNHVVCVDVNEERVERLRRGEIPIFEPGLEDIVERAIAGKRLSFTADAAEAVAHAELQFIAVGTPPDEDGSADLTYVLSVARTIAEHMTSPKIVIDKSTVPVGTADRVRAAMQETLSGRGVDIDFHIVSNPEFLKEGAAIEDFMKPDRIIIGTDSDDARERMRELYGPFARNHQKIIEMDLRSAEFTKYVANAMLATKISFMNEMAVLAEKLGADIEHVRLGIGSDPRIGYQFIYPGCGFGGSCFPKDVQALAYSAQQVGFEPLVLKAVRSRNELQKGLLFEKIRAHFGGQLAGRTFAVWGLAFKPNTDDMREAPSRTLMEALWEAGAKVQAFDPEAMHECGRVYGERADLKLCDSPEAAVSGADALVVVTEWQLFRSPDFQALANGLSAKAIFDGRNLYDPGIVAGYGLRYYGIGRGESVA